MENIDLKKFNINFRKDVKKAPPKSKSNSKDSDMVLPPGRFKALVVGITVLPNREEIVVLQGISKKGIFGVRKRFFQSGIQSQIGQSLSFEVAKECKINTIVSGMWGEILHIALR